MSAPNCSQALVAGFFVGTVTLAGGLTRLIDFLALLIPLPVIRGVQLQVGCKLALKGVNTAMKHVGSEGVVEWRQWGGGGGLAVSCCCLCFLLITTMPLPAPCQQQHHANSTRTRLAGVAPGQDAGKADKTCQKVEEAAGVEVVAGEERQHVLHNGVKGSLQAGKACEEESARGLTEAQECGATKNSGRGEGVCGMAQQNRCDVEAGVEGDGSVRGQHREGLERYPLLAEGAEVGALEGEERAAWCEQQGEVHCDGHRNQQKSCEKRVAQRVFGRGSSSWHTTGSGIPFPSWGSKGDAAQNSILGTGCGGGLQGNQDFVVPSCLLVVVLGVGLTVASQPSVVKSLKLGPSIPQLLRPTANDTWVGVVHGGFSQLPLTLLNSVLGLSQLASATFPSKDTSRWSPGAVATSVGLINIFSWLGSMPVCHGSGGLAAQASPNEPFRGGSLSGRL
ncbi:hypothetical protein DUNSADRAFT_14752 [Dunaliella salina]|uniref:Uncharacterized protein n=1 Tax=Dunaliella salina TaxID=3046 RepID=A0ABQ7G6W4_DUNSA|nr:hypothetical protein DUNSADRAFT_14752 [Dunaliella salina]|eukprot:KAF5830321.1 hypothetical protein DUNSADRAFT_14752 [Dunaliella salina]